MMGADSKLTIVFEAGHGHGIPAVSVGGHWRRRIHRPLVNVRGVLVGMIQHLVVGHFLAGVGRHAPHRRDDAGLNAERHFIVGLVIANRVHQVIPLVQVGVVLAGLYFGLPNHISTVVLLACL